MLVKVSETVLMMRTNALFKAQKARQKHVEKKSRIQVTVPGEI